MKHTPEAFYAPNDRKGFYEWLYKDNVAYQEDDSAVIKEVPVCRFTGLKKAEEVEVLKDVPLYEAEYEPEKVQVYQLVDIQFARQLRRVDGDYKIP